MELKDIRQKLNLTQKELSKLTGISISMIAHIEQGTRKGSAETWDKIESCLKKNKTGISVKDDFLTKDIERDYLKFGDDQLCYLEYEFRRGHIFIINYSLCQKEIEIKDNIILTNLENARIIIKKQSGIL